MTHASLFNPLGKFAPTRMRPERRWPALLGLLCGAVMAITAGPAAAAANGPASAFPAKPVKILVGFPPGGPNDRLARELGLQLSEQLHQSVIIENKPGANSEIAAADLARATPDGYTLLFTSNGALAISPALKRKLPYDPLKDLAPIAVVASNPMLLVVSSKSKYHTFGDLVAAARAKPGSVTFASAGSGSPTQLAAELMKMKEGINLLHVPYKGGGPALMGVIGGDVDCYFGGISTALPLVRSGKLRALAITSAQRSPVVPDVPTISESGLKGYEAALWYSVLAPAGTPDPIVQALYKQINIAMDKPKMRSALASDGSNRLDLNPERFRAYLKADMKKWAEVIDAAHLRQ